ncbi:hypothetical protein [Spirillospora sp. NPDC029432]|uniref:hypothetical protein n=1 Tax=Spirillospora sp. NPDC029432 TaxID=3154599 RepID=UPI0034548355
MPTESDVERYGFAFDHRFARWLSILGIRPDTCHLTLAPAGLHVRFGPWTVRTPLDNVAGAETTGPYAAWKVIGPHLSLADRGLTFGTSTAQGVCVRFHTPVTGLDPLRLLHHPGLTVTVADPATVARRLNSIATAAGWTPAG